MSNACNVSPMIKNKNGEEVVSPLYTEILNVLEHAKKYNAELQKLSDSEIKTRACEIHDKLISKEIQDIFEECKKEAEGKGEKTFIDPFYEGTTQPRLSILYKITDIGKDTVDEQTKKVTQKALLPKYFLVPYLKDSLGTLKNLDDYQKVKKFNEDWGFSFVADVNNENDITINDNTIENNTTIPKTKFSMCLYEHMKPIIGSIYGENNAQKIYDKVKELIPGRYPMTELPLYLMDILTNIIGSKNKITLKFNEKIKNGSFVIASFLYDLAEQSGTKGRVKDAIKTEIKRTVSFNKGLFNYYKKTYIKQDENKTKAEIINEVKSGIINESVLDSVVKACIATYLKKDKKHDDDTENTKYINSKIESFINEQRNIIKKSVLTTEGEVIKQNELEDAVSAAVKEIPLNDTSLEDLAINHQVILEYNDVDPEARTIRDTSEAIKDDLSLLIEILKTFKDKIRDRNSFVSDENVVSKALYRRIDKLQQDGNISAIITLITKDMLDKAEKLTEILNYLKKIEAKTIDDNNIFANNELCGLAMAAIQLFKYVDKGIKALNSLYENDKIIKKITFNNPAAQETIGEYKQKISSVLLNYTKLEDEFKAIILKHATAEFNKIIPNEKWESPDGKQITIEKYLDENCTDIYFIEEWLTSVHACSNPFLNALSLMKKQAQQLGKTKTAKVKLDINKAFENLLKKASLKDKVNRANLTDFMFENNFQYIKDFDQQAYEEKIKKIKIKLKKEGLRGEDFYNALTQRTLLLTEKRDDLDGRFYPKVSLFPNEKFNALTDEQKEYWKEFIQKKAQLESLHQDLGITLFDTIKIRANKLELIKKHKFKAIKKIAGSWIKDTMDDWDYQTIRTTDFESKKLFNLPIYYTSIHDDDVSNITKDTTTSLCKYAEVIYNAYALKNYINIITSAEMLLSYRLKPNGIIEKRTYKEINVFEKNKKKRKYAKEPEPLEKPFDETNLREMLEQWMLLQVFRKQPYDTKKVWRFLTGTLLGIISFGTLALNSVSAVSNVNQGLFQIIPEGISGRFFTIKDLWKAFCEYEKNLLKPGKDWALLDIGANVQKNKMNLISTKFEFLHDYSEDINTNFNENRFEKLINGNLLYFFLHAGEHFLQNIGGMAVMNSEACRVEKDDNYMSAYDAFDAVNGELILKRGLTCDLNSRKQRIITKEEALERISKQSEEKNKKIQQLQERLMEIEDKIENNELYKQVALKDYDENDALGGPINAGINYRDITDQTLKESVTLNDEIVKISNQINKLKREIEDTIHEKLVINEETEIYEDDWVALVRDRASIINQWMHGVYNNDDKVKIQNHVLLRMALLYRKYLMPSLNRRFAGIIKPQYMPALKTEYEGFYVTMFKFHWKLIKSITANDIRKYSTLNKWVKEIVDAYYSDVSEEERENLWDELTVSQKYNIIFEKTDENGNMIVDNSLWYRFKCRIKEMNIDAREERNNLSDFQKRNLVLAYVEIGFWLSLVATNMILLFHDDDDDDDEKSPRWYAAIRYFLRRAQTEVGALCPLSLLLAITYGIGWWTDNKFLKRLGSGNMFNEIVSLLNQPIPGWDRLGNIKDIGKIINPKSAKMKPKRDKKRFKNERERLLHKQLTPYRQLNAWDPEELDYKRRYFEGVFQKGK